MIRHEAVRTNCKHLMPGSCQQQRSCECDDRCVNEPTVSVVSAHREEIALISEVRHPRQASGPTDSHDRVLSNDRANTVARLAALKGCATRLSLHHMTQP
jgi:hypothetical protein